MAFGRDFHSCGADSSFKKISKRFFTMNSNTTNIMRPSNLNILSSTQRLIIMIGLISHVVFIPTIHLYLTNHIWGGSLLSWTIANRIINVYGYDISTYSIITGHVITSYLLLLSMIFQFSLMLLFTNSSTLIIIHRIVGSITTMIFLPLFCLCALTCSFFVIVTPFNKILFGVLPLMITYGMLRGVFEIHKGSKIKHVDGMYLAIICLNAAPFFRLIVGLFFLLGLPTISVSGNHEPDDYGALLRTTFLILALTISYWSVGRLKKNIYPIVALFLVLLLSLKYSPWQFFGTPLS